MCPLDLGKETDAVLSEDGAYPRQKEGEGAVIWLLLLRNVSRLGRNRFCDTRDSGINTCAFIWPGNFQRTVKASSKVEPIIVHG